MKKHLLLPAILLSAASLFAQPAAKTPPAIRLIDKQLTLSGALGDASTNHYIGLDTEDKIIVNCYRLGKNGTMSISIRDFNLGREIYKRDGFDTLRDLSIRVPAKGIYLVSLKTGSLLGKDVKLTLDRIPAGKAPFPKTGLNDTTTVEVVNTTVRVFTKNSPQSNNIVVPINLPPNTAYWTFWVGAGRDAIEKMKAFESGCSTIGALYPSHPMVLYGMKHITALPMTSSNATVSYHFMDGPASIAFKNKQQYSFYYFKSAQKITTEYSFIYNHQADLNMGITNESSSPQDVWVRVSAFIVKTKDR